MPVQIDYPTSLGSRDDWKLQGAASKLAAVAGADGDASVVYASSGGAEKVQLFQFPAIVGVTDPVTTCGLNAWVREFAPSSASRDFYFFFNGVQAGPNWGPDIHVARPSYISTGYSAVAPTLAEVAGEHGFLMRGHHGPDDKWEVWVTAFYRSTDFTYAAGAGGAESFAHLIGSIAAAIGANLLMREMPALARTVASRTRTLIKPSEYAEALSAWKAERHVHLVGA